MPLPDRPIVLPEGRLVCRDHRRVACHIRYCDYSSTNEVLSLLSSLLSNNTDDTLFQALIQGLSSVNNASGIRIPMPSSFAPYTGGAANPREIFQLGSTPMSHRRSVNRNDPSQILIYTDGSCLNNGRADPQAGCGVVFCECEPGNGGHLAFRLENRGPSGEPHPQTSNRAEMRAVLAALQVRYWPGEGLKSVVIATDSEYVFKGATEWVYRWQQYGWYTARGPVRNKDLWLALWAELDKLSVLGLQLYFWKIPRDLNAEADLWAREGAIQDEEPSFRKIFSILS